MNIKSGIKNIIGFTVFNLPLVKRLVRGGLTIFVFHEISDKPSEFCKDNDLAISIKSYIAIINWIQSNYKIISPKDLLGGEIFYESSALITFDDGFYGSFKNGLSILEERGISSLFFLNMRPVIEGVPILSAVAIYLEKYDRNFVRFCIKNNLKSPFYLTLTPLLYSSFQIKYGKIDEDVINSYQGRFVNSNLLKLQQDNNLVFYANHFYDHWNARALSDIEIKEQYYSNKKELCKYKNYIDFFAFTNGEPEKAYGSSEVNILKGTSVKKIFSAFPAVNNKCNFVLNRVSLIQEDENFNYVSYKIFRGFIGAKLHNIKLFFKLC
jgi:peptidoglycan/xylan/chitin deacetylase (PgdA/CDA1 family)